MSGSSDLRQEISREEQGWRDQNLDSQAVREESYRLSETESEEKIPKKSRD